MCQILFCILVFMNQRFYIITVSCQFSDQAHKVFAISRAIFTSSNKDFGIFFVLLISWLTLFSRWKYPTADNKWLDTCWRISWNHQRNLTWPVQQILSTTGLASRLMLREVLRRKQRDCGGWPKRTGRSLNYPWRSWSLGGVVWCQHWRRPPSSPSPSTSRGSSGAGSPSTNGASSGRQLWTTGDNTFDTLQMS